MYKISITPEEIDQMPLASFPGEIRVIDSLGKDFDKAVAYLRHQKVIGFDTESRPSFSPDQPHYGVSLLQLSGPNIAYLFRIKKTGMAKSLCRVLANPKILKIGAATADDIRGLKKHCGFEPAGFVDLQKIVWEYGIRDKSVKKMSAIVLGCRISKSQQLSNWEAEHLSESQQRYAATDAWVCREIYFKLMASEKHPLTPEEMIPPQQLEQMQAAQAAREAHRAEVAAAEQAAREAAKARRQARAAARAAGVTDGTGTSASAKRRRRRRRAAARRKSQTPKENSK